MSTAQREKLPTPAEIDAMTDLSGLERLRNRINKASADIEVELDFSDRDDEWAKRARSALSAHLFTGRSVDRRINALKYQMNRPNRGAPGRRRPDHVTSPLTLEVLVDRPQLELSDDIGQLDGHLAWIAARINAASVDRDSELAEPPDRRDTLFVGRASGAIRWLNLMANDVRSRRAAAVRAARRQATAPIERLRERIFIDLAREQLDPAVYAAIWQRVDQLQPRDLSSGAMQ